MPFLRQSATEGASEPGQNDRSFDGRLLRTVQRQAERLADEDAHLLAGHCGGRTVVAAAAPADHRPAGKLLDPVLPDGQRFLMINDGPVRAQLVVVEHWFEELKARVPPGRF